MTWCGQRMSIEPGRVEEACKEAGHILQHGGSYRTLGQVSLHLFYACSLGFCWPSHVLHPCFSFCDRLRVMYIHLVLVYLSEFQVLHFYQ